MPDQHLPPSPPSSLIGDPKIFVLRRELSEVHLLLDNISSNPDKSLPLVSSPLPDGMAENWLRKICEIECMPITDCAGAAESAELLIRTKDHLNTLAKPASGLTIAFTHLVTHEADEGQRAPTDPPSRGSLACTAYPELVGKAKRFRVGMLWVRRFLLCWLVLTCALSWYVAFGNGALGQRAAALTAYVDAAKRLEDVITPGGRSPRDGDRNAVSATTDVIPLACPPIDVTIPDELDKGPYSRIEQRDACQMLRHARIADTDADQRIAHWLFRPARDGGPALSAFAVALNGILGVAILPVFYGILGAGAAILRTLSGKTRLSLLAPRDLSIAMQQMALGAVMGACIGIFVAQPAIGTAAASANAIGPVALSGSALSFIAGFGVDAVFATLEGVIARIFNVRAAGTTNAATGAP